jgi:hypothetical protein
VVKTPASYSGDYGFKSRPQRPVILIGSIRGFPHFLQAIAGIV